MKKMYIEPAMMAVEVIATQMMAQSRLIIDGGTTVSGENALTKEDDYWDIWEE